MNTGLKRVPMSFYAYKDTEKVYSYMMTDEEWQLYGGKNPPSTLTLDCCGATAVCVQKNGVRYFDHPKDVDCCVKVLSNADFMKNKMIVIQALLNSGWDVQADKEIDALFHVDIYATKNNSKLAVQFNYDLKIDGLTFKALKEKEIKKTTKDALEKYGIKVLWLVEIPEKNIKSSLAETLQTYNKHSTVFAVNSKNKLLTVLGVCKTYTKNKFRILGGTEQMKLSKFAEEFFVNKRIMRREIDPKSTRLYYEYIELKCPSCGKKTIGITYISAFCQFTDGKLPQTMLIGKIWYTKADVEEIHKTVNEDLNQTEYCTRLLFNTFYDLRDGLVTKVRQQCVNNEGWFGIIATGITFKHRYTSKPLTVKRFDHIHIAKELSDWVWILKDEEGVEL